MLKIEKLLFTGKTHTTKSRQGGADLYDIELSTLKGAPANEPATGQGLTGIPGHPTAERLFAGAWSACYMGALARAASEQKVTLPKDISVDIEVDLGMNGNEFQLQARFDVGMTSLPRNVAESVVHRAHQICPYSKAIKGNIDVSTTIRTNVAAA